MIEVEVLGGELAPAQPGTGEIGLLCASAARRLGVQDGHVAVEFVTAERIAQLNERHRGRAAPTDVLSFPVDGAGPAEETAGADGGQAPVPRELGDILICPEHTADVREAVVHGMLHLLGMDHETDQGEMLELQDELLDRPGP